MPEPPASLPIVSLSPADAHLAAPPSACNSSACNSSACRAGSKRTSPWATATTSRPDWSRNWAWRPSAKARSAPTAWSAGARRTATFMIMGNICTRPCGFCSVPKGKTAALEIDEPERVAEAAARLGLQARRDHVRHARRSGRRRGRTLLSLGAGGSRKDRARSSRCSRPISSASRAPIERVVEAAPEVFNHNTETVPRLYREVRGRKSDYRWTLELLAACETAESGHQNQERTDARPGRDARRTVRHAGRPARRRLRFSDAWAVSCSPRPNTCRSCATCRPRNSTSSAAPRRQMGFSQVASGPFVRSSYHAREMAEGV